MSHRLWFGVRVCRGVWHGINIFIFVTSSIVSSISTNTIIITIIIITIILLRSLVVGCVLSAILVTMFVLLMFCNGHELRELWPCWAFRSVAPWTLAGAQPCKGQLSGLFCDSRIGVVVGKCAPSHGSLAECRERMVWVGYVHFLTYIIT